MPLKLYRISTTLDHHPDWSARLENAGKEISRFFRLDIGDEETIKRRSLVFVAGEAYTLENIDKTDYISSFAALLFSKRFVERVGNAMNEDMQFFPCKLICDGVSLDWYAAKITRRLPIIDKEASTYRTLVHGGKMIEFAKYRRDIEEPFFIAKDENIEYSTYFVVSELFMDLCKENGLLIKFDEPEITFPSSKKSATSQPREEPDKKVDLKEKMTELIEHLNGEKIIELNELDILSDQTFEDIVLLLRKNLQEAYPEAKLKPRNTSVHYANGFPDEKLKQSAFVLDEIKQYLTINKFLNHDASVKYFNKRITSKGFVINPTALVGVMIESLLRSKRK